MSNLFAAEFRKTWSRPIIIAAFVLLCVAQIMFALQNYDAGAKEYAQAYNSFGGKMNDEWRAGIQAEYERLWEISPKAAKIDSERLLSASLEQRTVLNAYRYTFFTEMIDEFAEGQAAVYGDFAREAYAGLRTASEEGKLEFGSSPAAEAMTNQYSVGWSVLLFMLMLCADIFSGERERAMSAMQSVTKDGRKKLFLAKLAVCQMSTLIVWSAANLVYAAVLMLSYGRGNLEGVVQDFAFNACPYDLNIGEYLAVVLLLAFAASQICGLVIFLLARFAKNTLKAIALIGAALILPYMLASLTDSVWLAICFPCLMNGQWLWGGLYLIRAAGTYIHMWFAACAGMVAVGIICVVILRRDFRSIGYEI